jgi:carbon monoxide dehydrogenase subunit G
MARFEHQVSIRADPALVWQTWTDLERWPEWSPPMKGVRPEASGPLAVGTRARVEAEGAPAATWEVTRVDAGTYFEWQAAVRGVKTTAGHRVEPSGNGTTLATASVEYRGLMAILFRPMLKRVARRNVVAECEGLKQRCEAAPPAPV